MLPEVEGNLSSVSSTLGEEEYGYAGAILSILTYATLAPMTHFITPAHPRILTVPAVATQYANALLKTQYDKTLRTFSEY